MQVYFLDLDVVVAPCFTHFAPGLTAALASGIMRDVAMTIAHTTRTWLFIGIC